MAQATLSCPFGAIHLENRRGPIPVSAFAERALTVILPPGPPFTGDALQKDLRTLPAGKGKIAGPSCPGDTGPYPVEI